jgi:hypothetical protein
MDKDSSANAFALSGGADHEIRRILDRRELRRHVSGGAVLVGHHLMDGEILANRLEHLAVEIRNAILASAGVLMPSNIGSFGNFAIALASCTAPIQIAMSASEPT